MGRFSPLPLAEKLSEIKRPSGPEWCADEVFAVALTVPFFVGARLALNDVQDTTALLGAIVDVEDRSTALFVEAERRLGDSWKLEFESRLFLGVSDSNPLTTFKDDAFLVLRLSSFF